jgi:transcriptional regulator with XRE-family HTH domain
MAGKFAEDRNEKLRDQEFAREFGAEVAKVDFAVTLTKARKKAGVTQAQLANLLGVKQSYIAKLERGDNNPTLGKAGKILAALGLCLQTNVAPLKAGTLEKGDLLTECIYYVYGSNRYGSHSSGLISKEMWPWLAVQADTKSRSKEAILV